MQLHPAELGSVDIQLDFEVSGSVSALITAERPETLELLQRDSRLLERSLGDSGLKLSSDGLSFALKQDQQQQQPGQNFHEQARAREAAWRRDRAYDDNPQAEPAASTRRIDRLRLLDIET
ncbi:MAG: flagellar hook-length control protein FliK [Rhizobiales bacterium]|nr:flagellar hook-length control protein FliK [Hyphomicrobiales bacterium]